MRLKVYLLLAVAHYCKVEQRELQMASGLGANTMSLWKVNKRHPTVESFYRAQCALVKLAGLPAACKEWDIEILAKHVIK